MGDEQILAEKLFCEIIKLLIIGSETVRGCDTADTGQFVHILAPNFLLAFFLERGRGVVWQEEEEEENLRLMSMHQRTKYDSSRSKTSCRARLEDNVAIDDRVDATIWIQ